ncbi:hypothetical protein HPY42_01585 [Coprothermobacteraceae bacterium]|nr:hypothetical protein [Coprothermobacteraceae bacterium]
MKIEGISFGEIIVDGRSYHNDIVICGDIVQPWQRMSSHRVELDDIKPHMPEGTVLVVFGTGFGQRVIVSPLVKQYLLGRGIGLIEQETPEAVKTFNELVEKGQMVVAFLHVYC